MLGGIAYRWRYAIIVFWAVVAVLGGIVGGGIFDQLGKTPTLSPHAPSKLAADRIDQLTPQGPIMIAVVSGRDVYDEGLSGAVIDISAKIKKLDHVVTVSDMYSSPGGQVSGDNMATTIRVELRDDLTEKELRAIEDQVSDLLHTIPAPKILVGGKELTERAFAEQAVHDLAIGEGVALALLLVVLVLIFGGVLGAAAPLLVAITTISTTLLALYAFARIAPVSEYTVNIVTLLGLGLAVDYSLLIVARFREERAAGSDVSASVTVSATKTGQTVLISAFTVTSALLGLMLFDEPLLVSMALGGSIVVFIAAIVAVTLVPALLAVYGNRLSTSIRPPTPPGFLAPLARWGILVNLARLAQRKPGRITVWTALILALLSVPFLSVDLQNSDARALPHSHEVRQAYDAYERLTGSVAQPVDIVAEVPEDRLELRTYLNQLLRLPDTARLSLDPDAPEGTTIVHLTPVGTTSGEQAQGLVQAVRSTRAPFPVLVGGAAAEIIDYRASVASRLPLALLVICLATFILLYWLTRSLVIPCKALIFSLLSVGATFGTLSLLFGQLDVTTPVLLFVFAFGLSCDYEVFLLSRITEDWRQHGDNDRAVLSGISATGPVVTAAALCVMLVFAGFAAAELVAVREIGVGMLIAVFLDVTVVRGLLLPASMTLLGAWNWWPGHRPTLMVPRAPERANLTTGSRTPR